MMKTPLVVVLLFLLVHHPLVLVQRKRREEQTSREEDEEEFREPERAFQSILSLSFRRFGCKQRGLFGVQIIVRFVLVVVVVVLFVVAAQEGAAHSF